VNTVRLLDAHEEIGAIRAIAETVISLSARSRMTLTQYNCWNIATTLSAGVSIEVFADLDTTGEDMLGRGRQMFSWIPNTYINYPCTHEGLRAAHMSTREGLRFNMTQCFGWAKHVDSRIGRGLLWTLPDS
jgi:transaldolase